MGKIEGGGRRLWPAVAAWIVAATALTIILVETLASPLKGQSIAFSTARTTAYVTAGLTELFFIASALAFAFIIWLTLRWIGVAALFGQVLGSLALGFWVLAIYAGLAAVVLWLAPLPSFPADALGSWESYRRSFLMGEPLRSIWMARFPAMVVALASVTISVKHRVSCIWLDAGIAIGCGVAFLLALSLILNLLSATPG
jgi:hypothetical protein